MKITKSQLKQIIKEELLVLELFDTGSAGGTTSPHVVTSRGHSQDPVLSGNIVHTNNGKGWESPQEALDSLVDPGEWKALQAKHPGAILYPEMAEDGKAYIFKHSF